MIYITLYPIIKKIMTWRQKVEEWKSGKVLTNPESYKGRFIYETSICSLDKKYDETFKRYPALDKMRYDAETFEEYIKKSDNNYVTYFNNLSGDTILVIPMPLGEFTTIKEFMDNASLEHQVKFWKKVASIIEELWSEGREFYV